MSDGLTIAIAMKDRRVLHDARSNLARQGRWHRGVLLPPKIKSIRTFELHPGLQVGEFLIV
jgi:hypothetical protein